MSDAPVPPGWYDDGSGARRWWDGSAWTEHTSAPEGSGSYTVAPTSSGGPTSGTSFEQVSGGYQPYVERPRRPRRRLPFVVAGAAVVLLIAAAALAFGLGGAGAGKPEATVTRAFDALKSGDCDAFTQTLATDSDVRENIDCEQFAQFSRLADSVENTVTDSSTDGDEAEVDTETSLSFQGRERTQSCTYSLVKEQNDWRIEDVDCR